MKEGVRHLIKTTITSFLAIVIMLVVVFATVISLARYFMPSLDQYEQKIAHLIAQELNLNVSFGTFVGDWYRFSPALKVTDIILQTHQGEVVTTIDTLYISINILASITERKIVPSHLNVMGLNLALQQSSDGSFSIPHWPYELKTDNTASSHVIMDALNKYDKIIVRRSDVTFEDQNGKIFPLDIRRMVLSRTAKNHHLDAWLSLQNQPTQLNLQAEINGDLSNIHDLTISSYVQLENMVFNDYFTHYPIHGYAIHGGNADITAWIDWKAGQLKHLQTQLDVTQLSLLSPTQKTLPPMNIKTEFVFDATTEQDWTLSTSNLLFSTDDEPLSSMVTKMKIHYSPKEYEFMAEKVNVATVSKVLSISDLLTPAHQDLLAHLSPKGNIQDIKLTGHDKDWQMGLQFNELSFQAFEDIPAIINLSGEFIGTPQIGRVSLSSQDVLVDYTAVFPYDFFLTQVHGDIFWRRDGALWEVYTEDFVLKNQDAELETKVVLKGGEHADTYLEVSAHTSDAPATHVYHYIPVGVLDPKLNEWLRNSIGSEGMIDQLNLHISGLLKDFPFYDAGNGAFRLALDFKDGKLTFDPNWPPIEQVDGELLLSNRNLQIALKKAKILQTDLFGAYAALKISETEPIVLHAHGETITSGEHAIQFVNATPLSQELGSAFNLLDIRAPLTVTVDLAIPLDGKELAPKVDGKVQITEGEVDVKDWDLHFTKVNGVLAFTETGASSSGISAQLFERDVMLTVTPVTSGKNTITEWKLATDIEIAQLAKYFPHPLWEKFQGRSQFLMSFNTQPNMGQNGFELTIASDLKGIGIDFPAPIGKSAQMITPLRYTTLIGNKDKTDIFVSYNKVIEAVFGLTHQNNQSVLTGGRVQLGAPLSDKKIPTGIFIAGNLPSFSYDTWDAYIHNSLPQEENTENQPSFMDQFLSLLKKVDVSIAKLEAFHYPLTAANIQLSPNHEEWLLQLNSKEWSGTAQIPYENVKSPIHLNFTHCDWESKHYQPKKNSTLDPRTIPALSFICNDFYYNQKALGQVSVNAVPDEMGLRFDQISMVRKNDKIDASGRWYLAEQGERTRISGKLDSQALDKTLLLFDVKSTILNAKTQSEFSLNWPASPFDFALAHLSGDVDIQLNNGTLVDVNPGFGRILSLLSVQSLQRRLRLDFSDVFKKGFSFDSISASIHMENGLAHTNNLVMDAPAAQMKMQGDVNLANKQLDLNASLTTHITSSLPIAATIASGGNPIVGAVGVGVWAVDKLVKSQTGDLLASNYHITGTWEKPIVNGK